MDYELEELIPIVAELAQKYTGIDSTSITYEKAQMLMSGVIYCLNEYRDYTDNGLINNTLTLKEKYHIGAKLVIEKATEVRNIYHEISAYFDDYHVTCLSNIMQEEIPEFLKWYDAKYCPQNTILTLEYPLLMDISALSGVNAILIYIRAIKTEQLFLRKFERNYIIDILKGAMPGYKQMLDNVCRIVLVNTIGHTVLNKPLCEIGFSVREYERLEKIFQLDSMNKIAHILHVVLQKMIEQIYGGNQEMLHYFAYAVKDMSVCIDTAVRTKQLHKIFVI